MVGVRGYFLKIGAQIYIPHTPFVKGFQRNILIDKNLKESFDYQYV
jgi:hypothetical protein